MIFSERNKIDRLTLRPLHPTIQSTFHDTRISWFGRWTDDEEKNNTPEKLITPGRPEKSHAKQVSNGATPCSKPFWFYEPNNLQNIVWFSKNSCRHQQKGKDKSHLEHKIKSECCKTTSPMETETFNAFRMIPCRSCTMHTRFYVQQLWTLDLR